METSCAVWRSTGQNPPFGGELRLSNVQKEHRFRRVWPSRGHGRAGLERKGLGFGRGLHRQATSLEFGPARGQAEILGGDRLADIESARAPRSAAVAGRTRAALPSRLWLSFPFMRRRSGTPGRGLKALPVDSSHRTHGWETNLMASKGPACGAPDVFEAELALV